MHVAVGMGAPLHNSDFQHFSPLLNVILPQWSQHNGCFHTLRDKGRRLRHDTAPFQAEASILESLKNRGKREMRTIKTATEKTSTTTPLCPLSMPGATWASVAAEGVCVGLSLFFSSFLFASCWRFCHSGSFTINSKKSPNHTQTSQQQTKGSSRHRERNAIRSCKNASYRRCHLPFGQPQGKVPNLQLGRDSKKGA